MTTAWNPRAFDRLRALDPRVAEVFRLRCIEEKPEADVAEALHLTVRTVRRDLEKARMMYLAARRFDPPIDGDAELTDPPAPPKPPAPLTAAAQAPEDRHARE